MTPTLLFQLKMRDCRASIHSFVCQCHTIHNHLFRHVRWSVNSLANASYLCTASAPTVRPEAENTSYISSYKSFRLNKNRCFALYFKWIAALFSPSDSYSRLTLASPFSHSCVPKNIAQNFTTCHSRQSGAEKRHSFEMNKFDKATVETNVVIDCFQAAIDQFTRSEVFIGSF